MRRTYIRLLSRLCRRELKRAGDHEDYRSITLEEAILWADYCAIEFGTRVPYLPKHARILGLSLATANYLERLR